MSWLNTSFSALSELSHFNSPRIRRGLVRRTEDSSLDRLGGQVVFGRRNDAELGEVTDAQVMLLGVD